MATKNEKASETYASHQYDIDQLLEMIEDAVDNHAERAAFCITWGYIGDLARVRNDLKNILAYLTIENGDENGTKSKIENDLRIEREAAFGKVGA